MSALPGQPTRIDDPTARAQHHIRRIRRDKFGLLDDSAAAMVVNPLAEDLRGSLQQLSEGLYSEDVHFIFELIQNAEHNTYPDGVAPALSFRLLQSDPTNTPGAQGALVLHNNETGFTEQNVDALCAVGRSTKTKQGGYIGEKGIGFKSVFQVSSTPHIFSGGYRRMRIEEDGVSNATVDHDFTYLKSALLHEYKKTPSRVLKVPHIPKSREDSVRKGFLEFDGYEKVLVDLPRSLKCMFVVAYHIGNRKGVLLELKWTQVDFENDFIRFTRLQNRKPVPVAAPIYGDMREWLTRQKAFRDRHFPKCEHVFFWYPTDCEIDPILKTGHGGRRSEPGAPIRSFYESWDKAVANAGYPDLLFHDLRRSAVRNMIEKVGLSEKKAMEISGHKTRSMILRYDIVSLADVKESGEKMDAWIKAQRKQQKRTKRPTTKKATRRKKSP
jgi:integrase